MDRGATYWMRWGLFLSLLFFTFSATEAQEAAPYAWARNHRLVAHALGGIDGHTYTNSLEAFLASYAHGQRVFEVDLSLTSDGQLVAVHDWSSTLMKSLGVNVPASKADQPLTLAQFKKQKIHGLYTPLCFRDLAALLQILPDAVLITDTKVTSGPAVITAFTSIVDTANQITPHLIERIVPQIYNQPMYDTLRTIHYFRSLVYALYKSPDTPDEAIRFMQEKGILVVAVPHYLATPALLKRMKAANLYAYVHTVDDEAQARSLAVNGAYGFYTNFMLPNRAFTATTRWTIDLPVE